MSNPIWRAIEDLQKQLELLRLEVESLKTRLLVAESRPKPGRPRKDDEARAH